MKGICQNIKGKNRCLPSSCLPIIFKFFAINIFYFYNQNSSLIFYITIKVMGIEDINESALTGHDFIQFIRFFLNLFFCLLNYFQKEVECKHSLIKHHKVLFTQLIHPHHHPTMQIFPPTLQKRKLRLRENDSTWNQDYNQQTPESILCMIYCDLLILPRKISLPTQNPCEDKQG